MQVRLRIDGRVHEVEVSDVGGKRTVTVDGHPFAVDAVKALDARRLQVVLDGSLHELLRTDLFHADIDGVPAEFTLLDVRASVGTGVVGSAGAEVRPPMPGRVVAVRVRPGESVEAGQVLFVLEAMKMQNEVTSPATGVVSDIRKLAGATVDTGDVVVVLGPPAAPPAPTPVVR